MRATHETAPEPRLSSALFFEYLAGASPPERSDALLRSIEECGTRSLDLSRRNGGWACLDQIDLGRAALETRLAQTDGSPRWWDSAVQGLHLQGADLRGASLRLANLQGANLRSADLEGARLGDASLRGALLEQAQIKGADLAGADLSDAALGEANFQGAMLEEANLRQASLRYADLQGAVLEHANLEHADLWAAHLGGADVARADLRGAILEEADLRGARLSGADLRGANLRGANLDRAVLQGARLQGLDLTECGLKHIYLARAWLAQTEMRQEQLGGAIGEELSGDYVGAEQGYLALERNFAEIGDVDASSWAYRRKRRMQKEATRQRAHQARDRRDWREAISLYLKYGSHRFVEWLCDYGESTSRVIRGTLCVYLLFTSIYYLGGLLVRQVEVDGETVLVPSYDIVEVAVYSLIAMSTAGYADVGLQPRNIFTHLLAGLQGISLMVLAGLFGFIFASRLRR